jgi:hypothetical protein
MRRESQRTTLITFLSFSLLPIDNDGIVMPTISGAVYNKTTNSTPGKSSEESKEAHLAASPNPRNTKKAPAPLSTTATKQKALVASASPIALQKAPVIASPSGPKTKVSVTSPSVVTSPNPSQSKASGCSYQKNGLSDSLIKQLAGDVVACGVPYRQITIHDILIFNTHRFSIVMHVHTYGFRHDSYESILKEPQRCHRFSRVLCERTPEISGVLRKEF